MASFILWSKAAKQERKKKKQKKQKNKKKTWKDLEKITAHIQITATNQMQLTNEPKKERKKKRKHVLSQK